MADRPELDVVDPVDPDEPAPAPIPVRLHDLAPPAPPSPTPGHALRAQDVAALIPKIIG